MLSYLLNSSLSTFVSVEKSNDQITDCNRTLTEMHAIINKELLTGNNSAHPLV
jgi:hypothetical protein